MLSLGGYVQFDGEVVGRIYVKPWWLCIVWWRGGGMYRCEALVVTWFDGEGVGRIDIKHWWLCMVWCRQIEIKAACDRLSNNEVLNCQRIGIFMFPLFSKCYQSYGKTICCFYETCVVAFHLHPINHPHPTTRKSSVSMWILRLESLFTYIVHDTHISHI